MTRATTIFRTVAARPSRVARLRSLADRGLLFFLMLLACLGVTRSLTAQGPIGLLIADFNHDGIPDTLSAATQAGYFVLNFGSAPYGTFSSAAVVVPYPAGCSEVITNSVTIGDFNGDGLPDIALTCSGSSSSLIFVMLGNGDGTFHTVAEPLPGLKFIASGDFNHDGKLDIVAEGTDYDDSTEIEFYAGNGDGTFAQPVTTYLPYYTNYNSITAVDLNNDKYPDLVLANFQASEAYTMDVFGNNQDGTFGVSGGGTSNTAPNTSVTVGNSEYSSDTNVLTGNFFGTGLTDLGTVDVGTTPGVYIAKNTSSGNTFSFATASKTLVSGLQGAVAASFTSAYTDLLVANDTSLTVLANNGSGVFGSTYSGLSIASTTSLFAAADANGDGHADVYTANIYSSGPILSVNLLSGTATATSGAFSLPAGTQALAATWPGNINFSGVTANGLQTVNSLGKLTSLTSSLNPALNGQSVTFTAGVAPLAQGTYVPTGSVMFSDGTNVLGTGMINGGVATLTTNALSVGTHTITALYTGDSIFGTSFSTVSELINPNAPVLTSFTPNTAQIGDPAKTITITGSNFFATTIALINGTAIATTYVSPTSLTAVVPSTYFGAVATLTLTLENPSPATLSNALTLPVTAPPVVATYVGPSTSLGGSQPTLNLTVPAYPIALTASLSLSTRSLLSSGVTDPNVLFANGLTTYSFTIPANSTTIPTIQLQVGTVAETITIPLVLTANGVNVTPAGVVPVVITVPTAVPVATAATVVRSGNQITVTVDGFSNTREIVQADFTFVPVPGATLTTTQISAPVASVFSTYYATPASQTAGSSFVYTQVFNVSGDADTIASVQVTLTNSIGVSVKVAAQ